MLCNLLREREVLYFVCRMLKYIKTCPRVVTEILLRNKRLRLFAVELLR